MPGVFALGVAAGDRFRRFLRVEDEAALVGGDDASGKEGEPRNGEGSCLKGAQVCQAVGLRVEHGEEGGCAGVMLGRQPYRGGRGGR